MRISDWSSDVCSSDLRIIVAPEGAVMLTRRPDIEFGAEQRKCKRQAHAGQLLGQRHYVRRDAHVLKAEETACTPTARLNIVDDQQRAMRFRNGGDAAQPLRRRGVQTAFALHRFDQYGVRRIQTAGWIVKSWFAQRRLIGIRPTKTLHEER